MKNKGSYVLAGIMSLFLVTGCGTAPEAQSEESDIRQVPIEVTAMKKDAVESTYVTIGEVVPKNQIDLFVSGGGYIEAVQVKLGDVVEVGDLVIQLDESVADRSNYNATESQLRTTRNNLKVQLDAVNTSLERQQALFAEGLITKVELEQVELQAVTLEGQYNNAAVAYRNQLSALQDGLDNSVKNRTIYSPVSGTVAAVYAKVGQSASNQLALSIIDTSALYIETHISSDLKKQLQLGQSVRVKLDGQDTATEIGVIEEISDLPDQQTKMFQVLIHLPPSEAYIIGDYTEIEFILDRYEAVMVPTKSIVRSGADQYIYTYQDEVLTKELITTGLTKGDWVEVKEWMSLQPVVVRGQNQLTADAQVLLIDALDGDVSSQTKSLTEATAK